MFRKKLFKILLLALVVCLCASVGCAQEGGAHVHAFEKKSETLATCTDNGAIKYVCFCGEIKTETVLSDGTKHQYSNDWSSSEEYHWHGAVCGHNVEVKDKQEHTVKDGTCVVCSFVTDRQAVFNKAVTGLKSLRLFNDVFDICFSYGDYKYLYKCDGRNIWFIVEGRENGEIRYSRSSYIFPTENGDGEAYIETVDNARNWEKINIDSLDKILQYAIQSDKTATIDDLPFYNVYKLLQEHEFTYDEEKDEYVSDRYSVTVRNGNLDKICLYDSQGVVKSTITYKYENSYAIGIPFTFKEHVLGDWEIDHDGNKFRKCTCHIRDFASEYESVPNLAIASNVKPNLENLILDLKEKYFFKDKINVKFLSDNESKKYISDGKDLYYYYERDQKLVMGGYFIVDEEDAEKVRIFNYSSNTWSVFSDLELSKALEYTVGEGNGENSYLGDVIKILEGVQFEYVDTFVKCFVSDGIKVFVEKINGEWKIKEIEGLDYMFHTVVFDFTEHDFIEPELGHVFGEWKTSEDGYLYRSCDCGRGIEHSGAYPIFLDRYPIPEENPPESETDDTGNEQ